VLLNVIPNLNKSSLFEFTLRVTYTHKLTLIVTYTHKLWWWFADGLSLQ